MHHTAAKLSTECYYRVGGIWRLPPSLHSMEHALHSRSILSHMISHWRPSRSSDLVNLEAASPAEEEEEGHTKGARGKEVGIRLLGEFLSVG